MSTNPRPHDAEREQTDESLRVEREITDEALGEDQAGIDELADAVITRARVRADKVLAAARAKTDRRPGQGAPGTRLAQVITKARALEDRVLRGERAEADETLSVERAAQTVLLAVEREETDKDLLRERKRSDDALAVRDEFLGIVSHDLRSMVNSIVLSASLIAEKAEGQHEEHILRQSERIRRAGARMDRLVGDLIDVASIEAGALAVTCENADAALVVAEAVETFQAQAAAHDVSLEVQVVGSLVDVAFDPARVLQVLSNLLSNAIKFSPRGGKVIVLAERTPEDLSICVADSGAGIPADKLEVIFDRFLRLDGRDKRGLGLGLYISRSIVQGHGGRIWAESKQGVGSKFYFTLPQPPAVAA